MEAGRLMNSNENKLNNALKCILASYLVQPQIKS